MLAQLIRSLHRGPLPATTEELSAWWRSVSAAHPDRPLAVLLNEAVRADQIREVPGGQENLVVATNRQPLPGLDVDGALRANGYQRGISHPAEIQGAENHPWFPASMYVLAENLYTFRAAGELVLTAYEYRCAFCGYDGRIGVVPVGIEATHGRWWAFGGPDDVDNGLCLCSLHHKLFDKGGVDGGHRILVPQRCVGHSPEAREHVTAFAGRPLIRRRSRRAAVSRLTVSGCHRRSAGLANRRSSAMLRTRRTTRGSG